MVISKVLSLCIIILVCAVELVGAIKWSTESLALQDSDQIVIAEQDFSEPLLFTLKIVKNDGSNLSNAEASLVQFYALSDFVRIDSPSGQVYLSNPPDYEIYKDETQEWEFQAYFEGTWSTCLMIPYTVSNVNDEKPVITVSLLTYYQFPENFPLGDAMFRIEAEDADGPQLTYHFEVPSTSELTQTLEPFRIDPESGIVSLYDHLDYESPQYRVFMLNVLVSDNGQPENTAKVFIQIDVTDVQDTPPFIRPAAHFFTVQENIAQNSIVGKVTAEDGDTANPNSIIYTITGSSLEEGSDLPFEIDRDSGDILVTGEVDAESLPVTVQITVQATEDCGSGVSCDSSSVQVTLFIENEDDVQPQFLEEGYFGQIRENSPVGTQVIINYSTQGIRVRDGDNERKELTLSINLQSVAGTFDINPKRVFVNGQDISTLIKLTVADKSGLDFEQHTQMDVQLLVEDASFKTYANVKIDILNQNDEVPVFSNPSIEIDVGESFNVGSPVYTFVATDEDSDKLSYNFCCDTNLDDLPFSLDAETGVLTLLIPGFDFETKQQYDIQIEAFDGLYYSKATLVVNIQDVNDNKPQFDQSVYYATVAENTDVFSLQMNAHDADGTGQNSELEYTVDSSTDGQWSISSEGVLKLEDPIDRENIASGNITVIVKVEDTGSPSKSSTAQVQIHVDDVNDVNPQFSEDSYTFIMYENFTRGDVVGVVSATDGDYSVPFSQVVYELDPNQLGVFSIDHSTGQVKLEALFLDIDIDDSEYVLTVTAFNEGQTFSGTQTSVRILVKDLNNKKPTFLESDDYAITIPENLEVGTVISTLNATDTDADADLKFYIQGLPTNDESSLQHPFHIDGNSLVLSHDLDRELISSYVITCEVRDLNAASADQLDTVELTITVSDVNDNAPKLVSATSFDISESRLPSDDKSIFTLTGSDADAGTNADFKFFLTYQEQNGKFRVDEQGNVFLLGDLDFEDKQQYSITVTLRDQPTRTSDQALQQNYVITINILNDNDNNPIIEFDSNNVLYIPENAPVGYVIEQFTAVDNDGDTELNFNLLRENGDIKIFINGTLYVAKSPDWETKYSYEIVVEVVDSADRRGSKPVTIEVTDVNDNSPVFSQLSYEFSVDEDAPVNQVVGVIQASDKDSPANADLTYVIRSIELNEVSTLSSNLFSLDETTGQLRVSSSLVGLMGEYIIGVEVSDNGDPGPLTNVTSVKITVKDVNDHKPVISVPEPNEEFQIYENAELHKVITVIEATDGDFGENSALTYSIAETGSSEGAQQFFEIKDQKVILKGSLDREVQSEYTLLILVEDSGVPRQNDDVTIVVKVLDVADSLPQFMERQVEMEASENWALGAYVGQVIAIDKDTTDNNTIIYEITNGNEDDHFSIDSVSGAISIKAQLDREVTSNYTLTVQACQETDVVDPQFDTQKVLIEILDYNDNPPSFSKSLYVAGLPVDVKRDSEVIEVSASDPDSSDVGNLKYYITAISSRDVKPDFPYIQKPFKIGLSSGVIERTFEFPSTISGYFDLDIAVRDTFNFEATSKVTIYLLNANQRLLLTVDKPMDTVLEELEEPDSFISTLSDIIGSQVYIDDVAIHVKSDGSLDETKTDLYIHCIENGTNQVMDVNEILTSLDNNRESIDQLWSQNKVSQARTLIQEKEDDNSRTLLITLLSILGALALILLFFGLIYYVCKSRKELRHAKKELVDAPLAGSNPVEAFMRKNQFHSPLPGTHTFSRNPLARDFDQISAGSNSLHSESQGSNATLVQNDGNSPRFGKQKFVATSFGNGFNPTNADANEFWGNNNLQLFLEDTQHKIPFSESQELALEIPFDDELDDERASPSTGMSGRCATILSK